jgi:hypothetical protein
MVFLRIREDRFDQRCQGGGIHLQCAFPRVIPRRDPQSGSRAAPAG